MSASCSAAPAIGIPRGGVLIERRASVVVTVAVAGDRADLGNIGFASGAPLDLQTQLSDLDRILADLKWQSKQISAPSPRPAARAVPSALSAHPGVTSVVVIMLVIGALMVVSGFGFKAPVASRAPKPINPSEAALLTQQLAASVIRVGATRPDDSVSGSGFFVGPHLVVTNRHVVDGATSLQVETSGHSYFPASLLALSPDQDMAVVCVPDLSGPPIPISTDGPVDGDGALMLGYPGAGPYKATQGSVTAAGPPSGTTRDGLLLQMDVRPGNSGSAVVDRDGLLIGLISGRLPEREVGSGYAASAVRAQITATGGLDACSRAQS